MIGIGDLGLSLRTIMVVVPVALYFLVLGLLNSRPRPQLLRGRRDFLLLVMALGPVFAMPVLHWVQDPWPGLAAAAAAVACGLVVLAPPAASWVVYNIPPAAAARIVGEALRAAGLTPAQDHGAFRLSDGAEVHLSAFPFLRNVSIRMTGAPPGAAERFERALAERIEAVPAETTPMAMALLLVAAAMLVAPLAMAAPQAGEIVRILTGMLY